MFTGRLVSRVKLRKPLSRVKNLYRRGKGGGRERERTVNKIVLVKGHQASQSE